MLSMLIHEKLIIFRLIIIIFFFVAGASIAGEASRTTAGSVAVIMSAEVDAYREALEGFKKASQYHVVAEYNMQGDFDRGREILTQIQSKVKPDLILAVGVWALQVVSERAKDIPVVYAMVLNPQNVLKAGAKNITGASMNVPVEITTNLFNELSPKIRRVGVIYNPVHTENLVRQGRIAARQRGLQLIAKEIRSPKEAIAALDSIQDEIDALWILPDDTNLVSEVTQYMLLFSYRQRIPLIGLSERQAEIGALLSVSFASSEDIGRQAGELANTILGGKAPAEIPYTMARRIKLTVNLKVAQKLEMKIPKSILERADRVIQ
jgi:putative tryptophan/tyrosine transport system substrate-binding protein